MTINDVDLPSATAAQVRVHLQVQVDAEVARTTTDTFGEFKLDKLPPNSGAYVLVVSVEGSGQLATRCELGAESVYVGVLKLAAGA